MRLPEKEQSGGGEISFEDVLSAEVGRRDAMKMALGFCAALMSACKGEEQVISEKGAVIPEKTPVPKDKGIEIPFNPNVKFPEYEFLKDAAKPEKPTGLDVTDEQLSDLSKKLRPQIENEINKYFLPTIEANPQNNNKVVEEFIKRMAVLIWNYSPETAEALDQFFKNPGKNQFLFASVAEINKYLIPSGLYIVLDMTDKGLYTVKNYEVEETMHVLVKDDKGSEKIPVYVLGEDKLGVYKDEASLRRSGTADVNFEHVAVFNDGVRYSAKDFYSKYSSKLTFEEFVKTVQEDLIRHEATHAFIARRFPKAGKELGPVQYKISLDIPFTKDEGTGNGKGKAIPLSGAYHPVMFQELCGVGAGIAASRNDTNYVVENYVQNPKDVIFGYRLVATVTMLAVLQEAENCLLKEKIIHTMSNPTAENGYGAVSPADFRELVQMPSFNEEKRKKVGEILYNLGYTLLGKVEGV